MNADLGIQYAKRIDGDKNENLETSIKYLNKALEVFHSSTYFEKWFLTLRWKGQLYAEDKSQEQISNINYAIDLYNDALLQIDLSQHPIEWGYIHQDLGDLYFILGNELSFNPKENISAAIEHYCQALDSAPNQDNLYQINLNEHLAVAYTKISAYELEPSALNAIHHYQVLEDYYQKTNLIKWTRVTLNIGKRYAELFKETKKTEYRDLALQYYSNTCLNLSFSDFPLIYLAILSQIGDTHFLDGNWEVAIQSYKRLAEKFFDYEAAPLDDQEDIQIYQSVIESLYRLAFCYVKNNDFSESLRIIESIKLKLLDQGSESLPLSSDDFLSYRSDTQLKENTVFFIPLITEHGSVIFIIPRCPDSMKKLRVVYISDLTIKTLMELISNESRTGWIDSFIEFKFSFGKKRNNFTYLFGQMNEISEKFWKNIFSEVFPILKKIAAEHLVIIPIGISRLIPYHVVCYQESKEKIYLADHFLISYAHGITTYNNLVDNDSAEAVKTALIVGVSEYSVLSNLPNAISEAKQVAQLFGCIPIIGSGASVETIKNDLKNYAYLHFACHATYGWSHRKSETIGPSLEYPGLTDHITKTIYSSNYSDAAIILTNDKPLFLKDITNEIKLQNTRLVTLSACDTGQVDISNSPDLVADFPLAFLKAGAQGIISSLWEVDDSSVILLMYQFYKQHLHEGLDPIHALQKAQHWLRNASRKEIGELYLSLFEFHNQFAFDTFTRITIEGAPNDKPFTHPFYWAGFFYTGI
jgi:CHAT domain-containing protein/TPR repeat protein